MRINKYLAHQGHSTRRGADALVQSGKVFINGARAQLGSIVQQNDTVEVRNAPARTYMYVAYHKPKGIETEQVPAQTPRELTGLFYVGRLDKASTGLLLLTNDGRITDRLLNPKYPHEKEYEVRVRERIPAFAPKAWERGVDIDGYTTKPAKVRVIGDHVFRIVLTEGKKHQVRRMCEALHLTVESLTRVRIMNIKLGSLKAGAHRTLTALEQETLLKTLGLMGAAAPQTSQKSTPPAPAPRPKTRSSQSKTRATKPGRR